VFAVEQRDGEVQQHLHAVARVPPHQVDAWGPFNETVSGSIYIRSKREVGMYKFINMFFRALCVPVNLIIYSK
jgi:hypothetical protein